MSVLGNFTAGVGQIERFVHLLLQVGVCRSDHFGHGFVTIYTHHFVQVVSHHNSLHHVVVLPIISGTFC